MLLFSSCEGMGYGGFGRRLVVPVNQCWVIWIPHVVLHKFFNLFLQNRCSYIIIKFKVLKL